jgi:hypothetical protein
MKLIYLFYLSFLSFIKKKYLPISRKIKTKMTKIMKSQKKRKKKLTLRLTSKMSRKQPRLLVIRALLFSMMKKALCH